MDNEIEKFTITKDEENALLFMYYTCLHSLSHSKGLKYKKWFAVKQAIDKLKYQISSKNISDYIEVINNVN